MKKIYILFLFTMVLPMMSGMHFSLSAKTITIQPKKYEKRQGTNTMDFWYDLPEGIYEWVYLYYSTDMKHYKRAKGQKGDIGKNVSPGKNKHIVWNMESDFPTEWQGEMDIVVKAKKKIIKEVGYYDTPGRAYGVYVSGSYAYVADGKSGLRIIDISSPSSPREVGYYDTPGWASGVYVSGAYAYVADGKTGLRIIKIK